MLTFLTPQKIIDDFQIKEDCTNELTELISKTPFSLVRKLQSIFLKLNNFDIQEIIHLTASKKRITRYTSTFLLFCKIKAETKRKAKREDLYEMLDTVYEAVFQIRYRDVDPLIRGMCIQFIAEWIVETKALRSQEYLKYLSFGLNDRSDHVRRKAIKAFSMLLKIKENDPEINKFCMKCKNRIVELSLFETNVCIKEEAYKFAVYAFISINCRIFSEEEILKIMEDKDNCLNPIGQKALSHILVDGIWDLTTIHRVLKQSHSRIFPVYFTTNEMKISFFDNVVNFIKQHSSCCGDSICVFDILKELEFGDFQINKLIDLVNTIKDNVHNTIKALEFMKKITVFKQHPGSTLELIGLLFETVKKSDLAMEPFIVFLKELETDFCIQVSDIVSSLKSQYLFVVKYFDVSSEPAFLSCDPSFQCYASLWRILDGDSLWVENLKLNPVASNYDEIIDFIIFFHEKSLISPECLSCKMSKLMFDKLHALLAADFQHGSIGHLYKLISSGLFQDRSYLLFTGASEDQLLHFIPNFKSLEIFKGYFHAFLHCEKEQERKLIKLAKTVSAKITKFVKKGNESFIFEKLKSLVSREKLLDSVLLYFVPFLSVNEAIVLEGAASKSKFKTACLRRCKMVKGVQAEENVTFL